MPIFQFKLFLFFLASISIINANDDYVYEEIVNTPMVKFLEENVMNNVVSKKLFETQSLLQGKEVRDNILSYASCYWINKLNVYDLTYLKKPNDYSLSNTLGKLYVQFCADTQASCNQHSSQMIWIDKSSNSTSNNSCKVMAGNVKDLKNKWYVMYSASLNETIGLKIDLSEGESCAPSINYSVKLEITCDENKKWGDIEFNQSSFDYFNPTLCTNTIKASAREGKFSLKIRLCYDKLFYYVQIF